MKALDHIRILDLTQFEAVHHPQKFLPFLVRKSSKLSHRKEETKGAIC
jgi:hypothetical protein